MPTTYRVDVAENDTEVAIDNLSEEILLRLSLPERQTVADVEEVCAFWNV